MSTNDSVPPPRETLALAHAWYARQMARLEKRHGPRWPANRDWLSDYLYEELRQRLLQLQWRRHDG
jgi:hypothetical protein